MPSEQTLDPNTPTLTVNPGQYDLPHTVHAPPNQLITGMSSFTITDANNRTTFTRLDTVNWEVGEENPNVTVPPEEP